MIFPQSDYFTRRIITLCLLLVLLLTVCQQEYSDNSVLTESSAEANPSQIEISAKPSAPDEPTEEIKSTKGDINDVVKLIPRNSHN